MTPADTTPFKQPKKPYSSPKLQIYGDLAQVTESNMGSHNADAGGTDSKNFTS